MTNTRYLRCAKCGCDATPRNTIKKDSKIIQEHETGTSTLMRCPDCCGFSPLGNVIPYATMCRDCCPTGHQTHAVI